MRRRRRFFVAGFLSRPASISFVVQTGIVRGDVDDLIARLRAVQKRPVAQDPVRAAAQERAKAPHDPWDVIFSQSGSIVLELLAVPLRAFRTRQTRSS